MDRLLSRFIRKHLRFFIAALLAPAAWQHAHAQSEPTADRNATLAVFGGATSNHTDYGSNNIGYTVGGDFTWHFRLMQPSLDVRYSSATGSMVGENSFAGGVKLETSVRRFHPYGNFLVGFGNIDFYHPIITPGIPPYTHDNSKVYDVGAGIDYDMTRSLSVKVDGQYQFWRLGTGANTTLTPVLLSVGVIYRLPYRYLRPRF